MDGYEIARPNTAKLMRVLNKVEPDWQSIAESLMDWLSDDVVGEWARINDYDLKEEE